MPCCLFSPFKVGLGFLINLIVLLSLTIQVNGQVHSMNASQKEETNLIRAVCILGTVTATFAIFTFLAFVFWGDFSLLSTVLMHSILLWFFIVLGQFIPLAVICKNQNLKAFAYKIILKKSPTYDLPE